MEGKIRDAQRTLPCKPIPPKFGGADLPLKFRGRPFKNTLKQGFSDTPPLKFRG